MSYPMWPDHMPLPLRAGYVVQGEQAVKRVKMESGPDRVVRTGLVNRRNVPFSVVLTGAQLMDFWRFYDVDAAGGAGWVQMPIRTGDEPLLHDVRFVSFPSEKKISRNQYELNFNLETYQQKFFGE